MIHTLSMLIEYADKGLESLMTDSAAKTGLPIPVIKAARRKIQTISAAPDERTLRNWKSLRYEKLKGKRSGQRSIRLNDQWRLILRVDSKHEPPKAILLGIEDYHD